MPSLKIIKISNFSISCDGGEEVQLLTAGVDPNDIEVKFYEVDKENHLIWEAYGQNISVDHDKTINFKTPPYRDVNIVEPKNVFLKLIRPSDGVVSDSRPFNYIPTRSEVESKRKRRPLRILESSMQFCSSEGKEHIILMVDKVNPNDIKVVIYEVDDTGKTTWTADGQFKRSQVHYGSAIILKVPPYKDVNISEPKYVFMKLVRPSDGAVSNSMSFVYEPKQDPAE